MKIYTRTGDDGRTALFGGTRVPKASQRIFAYGEVDELNSFLGWCAVAADEGFSARLEREQALLFVLGSHLATPADAEEKTRAMLPAWPEDAFRVLEGEIDAAEEGLEPLRNFILPGGSELAARLHLARTVCRRAERMVAALAADDAVDPQHIAYLNRLSDWLFVMARAANARAGERDVPWRPARG
jgi:cob(I)alamin adenosyltransferase